MANLLRYITALLFCCSLGLSVRAEEPVMKDEPKGSIVYTVKPISARTKLAKDMFREEWVPPAQIPQAAVSRIFELKVESHSTIFQKDAWFRLLLQAVSTRQKET